MHALATNLEGGIHVKGCPSVHSESVGFTPTCQITECSAGGCVFMIYELGVKNIYVKVKSCKSVQDGLNPPKKIKAQRLRCVWWSYNKHIFSIHVGYTSQVSKTIFTKY